jgi:hypothetical protein
MAQNALTVTQSNPTPPTNIPSTGVTGPNPPNYQRVCYANPFNMSAVAADGSGGRPVQTIPGVGVNQNPPPYYDDGAAGSPVVFAANAAAVVAGLSATDNNTGTTPGTNNAGAGGTGFNSASGSYPGVANGLVPGSNSLSHEGAGTETLATQTYSGAIYAPVALTTVGAGPALVKATTDAGAPVSPNSTHPSSLSPVFANNPTLTSIASIASGVGTGTCSATGTNFTRQSVLVVNGISYPTTFVSATNITAVTPKKATAGTLPVSVVTGGVVTTATVNWTFT